MAGEGAEEAPTHPRGRRKGESQRADARDSRVRAALPWAADGQHMGAEKSDLRTSHGEEALTELASALQSFGEHGQDLPNVALRSAVSDHRQRDAHERIDRSPLVSLTNLGEGRLHFVSREQEIAEQPGQGSRSFEPEGPPEHPDRGAAPQDDEAERRLFGKIVAEISAYEALDNRTGGAKCYCEKGGPRP